MLLSCGSRLSSPTAGLRFLARPAPRPLGPMVREEPMTVHIQSPFEWAWDRLKASVSGLGSTRPDEYWPQANLHPGVPVVRRIGVADLRVALARGFDDFGANRDDVIFLCVIYPVIGLVLGRLAFGYGMLPLLFPLAAGFTLAAPLRSEKPTPH